MTQITQTLPALGMSRRKIVIGRAFDLFASAQLSGVYKRAVLGSNSQNKPSSRPEFLRLYFATRAKNFPVSASSHLVQDQERARIAAKRKRETAHKARHAMPDALKTAGREDARKAWIENRIQTARARKAAKLSFNSITTLVPATPVVPRTTPRRDNAARRKLASTRAASMTIPAA